ncbi:MAG: iron-containing alcohol dehydrogenase, partial [Propionicimonas sp.]|nr:iron-containing alcohol dehydrogenase [Propionicimonas sp.]
MTNAEWPTVDWTAFAAQGVGPREILLAARTRHQLSDRVRQLDPARIALLADATPILSPEGDLKTWVADQLAGLDIAVDRVTLPASTTADEKAVETAVAGCRDADLVVTVGSGTISDIGKVA